MTISIFTPSTAAAATTDTHAAPTADEAVQQFAPNVQAVGLDADALDSDELDDSASDDVELPYPHKNAVLHSMQMDSTAGKVLQKKLLRNVRQASIDFDMLQDGDKVMVCLSGGKDSYTLLDMMLFLKEIVPFKIDVVAVNLDQKQPNYPEHILPEYLASRGVEYYIVEKDTFSVVKRLTPEGKTYCAVCSRLRRGSLYGFASEIGATKVALGHHRDDMMATFFLNLFHGGALKSMPAKLKSDDGNHILIRPLAYVQEKDIIKYASLRKFPIIPCNLCGSQENLQRAQTNEMLREWDEKYPKRLSSIFGALQNVKPDMLLDRDLFDFGALSASKPQQPPAEEDGKLRIPTINPLI